MNPRLLRLGCAAFFLELSAVVAVAWFAGIPAAIGAVSVAFITRLMVRFIAGPMKPDHTS